MLRTPVLKLMGHERDGGQHHGHDRGGGRQAEPERRQEGPHHCGKGQQHQGCVVEQAPHPDGRADEQPEHRPRGYADGQADGVAAGRLSPSGPQNSPTRTPPWEPPLISVPMNLSTEPMPGTRSPVTVRYCHTPSSTRKAISCTTHGRRSTGRDRSTGGRRPGSGRLREGGEVLVAHGEGARVVRPRLCLGTIAGRCALRWGRARWGCVGRGAVAGRCALCWGCLVWRRLGRCALRWAGGHGGNRRCRPLGGAPGWGGAPWAGSAWAGAPWAGPPGTGAP